MYTAAPSVQSNVNHHPACPANPGSSFHYHHHHHTGAARDVCHASNPYVQQRRAKPRGATTPGSAATTASPAPLGRVSWPRVASGASGLWSQGLKLGITQLTHNNVTFTLHLVNSLHISQVNRASIYLLIPAWQSNLPWSFQSPFWVPALSFNPCRPREWQAHQSSL